MVTKVKQSLQDRILNSPKTSIPGILLVALGVVILNMDLDQTMKMTFTTLLIGSGLTLLGIKDKK